MYQIDPSTVKESNETLFKYYQEILNKKKKQVLVAVLGDIGRSPRIQYHAVSLSKMNEINEVFLLGYKGEKCIPYLEKEMNNSNNNSNNTNTKDNTTTNNNNSNNSKISQYRISTFNKESSMWTYIPNIIHAGKWKCVYMYLYLYLYISTNISLFFSLYIVIKGLYLLYTLIYTILVDIPPFQCVIIQNPPCIPLLMAIFVVNKIRYYWCFFYYIYYILATYYHILCSIVGYENESQSQSQSSLEPPDIVYEQLHITVCLDWHNLGFTMYPQYNKNTTVGTNNTNNTNTNSIANANDNNTPNTSNTPNTTTTTKPNTNLLVLVSKSLEYLCSKWIVDEHICVSNAMLEYLVEVCYHCTIYIPPLLSLLLLLTLPLPLLPPLSPLLPPLSPLLPLYLLTI